MPKCKQDYQPIIVESFKPKSTAGRHGAIHIRPIAGQIGFSQDLFVECSKSLSSDYPVGTKFRICAKLSKREDGIDFVYSYFGWKAEVVSKPGKSN